MKIFKLKSKHKKILADTLSPVSIYMKIRDVFSNSLLLESSEYNQNNKNFSYVCCNPIASIQIKKNQLITQYPDGKKIIENISKDTSVTDKIHLFSQQFEVKDYPFKFISNGLFGFIGHEAIEYFGDTKFVCCPS